MPDKASKTSEQIPPRSEQQDRSDSPPSVGLPQPILEVHPKEPLDNKEPKTPLERRVAPHWSLLVAALILFAFLIDMIKPYLNPFTLSMGILIILYPSRRIRAIKPFLFLSLIISLITMWWKVGSLLTPFVISFILAYIFHPLVEWFVSRGIPRLGVVLGMIMIIIGGLVTIGWVVIPRLWDEITLLSTSIPRLIEQAKLWGSEVMIPWMKTLDIPVTTIFGEAQPRIPDLLAQIFSRFTVWSGKAISGILSFVAGILNIILIPILTIYILLDYSKVKRWVLSVIPLNYHETAYEFYRRADLIMTGYLRGQLLVSLFLAIWIGTGLVLVARLPYGLILGAAAGVLNLIPYVGTTSALIITLIVALIQENPLLTAFKALLVFISAQSIEGNLLTPRLIGNRVGLHPLVVIFVVLLFAYLFGFIGMIVAVPLTALSKVLWDIGSKTQWKFVYPQKVFTK
ncbi:MAG: AI-2E family transporter [bacterium]